MVETKKLPQTINKKKNNYEKSNNDSTQTIHDVLFEFFDSTRLTALWMLDSNRVQINQDI